jgi:phage major head subunit gpT-like protein
MFQSVSLAFQQALLTSKPDPLESLCQRLPCAGRDLRLPIVQTLSGAMKPWVGERVAQNIVVDGIVITPSKYEDTLQIPMEAFENDQLDVFSSMAMPLVAEGAKALPGQLIAAAIAANSAGYDGQPIFSASHPIDPSGLTAGVQPNVFTGSPLNATSLAAVRASMARLLRPDGKTPLRVVGQTLLVPPTLEYTARALAYSATIVSNTLSGTGSGAGGSTNPMQGMFDVVVSDRLPDTGNAATCIWYLIDNTRAIKAFQYVEKVPPVMTARVSPTDPTVFDKDLLTFGVRARTAAAMQMWFLIAQAGP